MNIKTITILFVMLLLILSSRELIAQTNDYNNSLNNYSFDIYREAKVEKENLFLSPLSTYYALLLAYEGSKNKTKQEFENVLYFKNSSSQNQYLANINKCPDFNVSNAAV